MATERIAQPVSFILTGFGPFDGVPHNPSSVLINRVKQEIVKESSVHLLDAFIIETSKHAARQAIEDIYQEKLKAKERTIVIHIGVNYKGSRFHLEQCAYNEATFRVPDERGCQPCNECILDDDSALGKCLETDLDVDGLLEAVQDKSSEAAESPTVVISHDPGRFVCNYTYCYSLSQRDRHSCLFLHVPPFEIIPEEEQLRFLVRLLRAQAKLEQDRRSCVTVTTEH